MKKIKKKFYETKLKVNTTLDNILKIAINTLPIAIKKKKKKKKNI